MMNEQIILNIYGLGTIIAQVILFLLTTFYILTFYSKNKKLKSYFMFVRENTITFAFFVATAATFGSLLLSEVLKYPPCDLCWWQRIFMYPQVIVLAIGMIRNDSSARFYSIALSILGLGFAIYHFFLQIYPTILPCTSIGVSCAAKVINLFGYITIPVMSATAFLLIIVILMYSFDVKKIRG